MDRSQQPTLIQALLNPVLYPGQNGGDRPVELIETHISWVILAGRHAYKIKKPVSFGFLDFSTLERRQWACEQEIEINQRYAPDLYLRTVAITGTERSPVIGGQGPALDYAVVMRRFEPAQTFDHLAQNGQLQVGQVAELAEEIARLHLRLPPLPEAVAKYARDRSDHFVAANFSVLTPFVRGSREESLLAQLQDWSRTARERLGCQLEQRIEGGHFKECHGDLHLGNVVLLDGRPRLFDGIEFNADLRQIDTLNEAAFTMMDLEMQADPHLACGFLDRYLSISGDHAGIALLDYYRLYRAMVRAKVAALRCAQVESTGEKQRQREAVSRHIDYGHWLIKPRPKRLIILHGLSGSGKSHLARALTWTLPALCVRSDNERKRPTAAPPRYSEAARDNVYRHILALAELLLGSGQSVIVDATFLKHAHREQARALAHRAGAIFTLLDCRASEAILQDRIRQRMQQGGDPSDATLDVLERQRHQQEPLQIDEQTTAIGLDMETVDADQLAERLRLPGLAPPRHQTFRAKSLPEGWPG